MGEDRWNETGQQFCHSSHHLPPNHLLWFIPLANRSGAAVPHLRKRYSLRDIACTAGEEEGLASTVPAGSGAVSLGVSTGGEVLTGDSGSQEKAADCTGWDTGMGAAGAAPPPPEDTERGAGPAPPTFLGASSTTVT